MTISRRKLLGAAGAAAVSGIIFDRPRVARADTTSDAKMIWADTKLDPAFKVFLAGKVASVEGRLFFTLMNFGNDSYYPTGQAKYFPDNPSWWLWAWSHDARRMYIYTAHDIQGPWADRGTFDPRPPSPSPGASPLPAYCDANHFSSGDIVYDPVGQRLISTPHGQAYNRQNGDGAPIQNSFVTQSKDGVNWTFVENDSGLNINSARLIGTGASGIEHEIHTGYGRLLRDLKGRLVKLNGYYWWIHRSQVYPEGGDVAVRVALSYAPTLGTHHWSRASSDLFTLPFGDSSLVGFGTFLHTDGKTSVHYTTYPTFTKLDGEQGELAAGQRFVNVALPLTQGVIPFTFAGPGVPVTAAAPDVGVLGHDALNIVEGPEGAQWAVSNAALLVPDLRQHIRVLRGYPPN